MSKLNAAPVRRSLVAGIAASLAAATVLAVASPAPAAPATAHWGNYQWSGGTEEANVRAFWLFDRTGDATVSYWIGAVANAWNSAREAHPGLPYIAVYKDNANIGQCFINTTPGWSVASACMTPANVFGIQGLYGANPDADGHMIGGAFAVSQGLTPNESFSIVCHNMGHLMGLDNSDDADSCMSHQLGSDEAKWYNANDEAAVLSLYDHDENPQATTTTTTAPEATTTTQAPGTTTTTAAPGTTTTTAVPATTTTLIPVPTTLPEVPTTLPGGTTTTTAPSGTTTTTAVGAGVTVGT